MNPYNVDIHRPDTWVRYRPSMCDNCQAGCCNMPVEARISDLIRMKVVDEFETGEPPKAIARRLMKEGVVGHFNGREEVFILARHSSGDCRYLDQQTRRCTIYALRPDTCRNHPAIGPRPGFCAHIPKG